MDLQPIEIFGRPNHEHGWKLSDRQNEFWLNTVLPTSSPSSFEPAELRQKLVDTLDRLQLDCLAIHGWSLPGAPVAMQWAANSKTPAIVMSESNYDDATRSRVKEMFKKRLLGSVSAGLVGGQKHKDYLQRLGIPSDGIFTGYNAIDNHYFEQVAGASRAEGAKLREQLELPEKFFIASTRFVEKKNLVRLIDAFGEYHASQRKPWHLVLLGDGELKTRIQSRVRELGLEAFVKFAGRISYDAIPAYYSLAQALVHVSVTEQWGLVVNEAMACGLPVIVSRQTGCTEELVHASNGLTCDAYTTSDIVDCLKQIHLKTPEQLAEMGSSSTSIIENFSTHKFAEGLKLASEHAILHPRRPALAAKIAQRINSRLQRV